MSDIPERIYLNIHDDVDLDDVVSWRGADVTWCVDRVYDQDIEYIRLDLHEADLARLRADRDALRRQLAELRRAGTRLMYAANETLMYLDEWVELRKAIDAWDVADKEGQR